MVLEHIIPERWLEKRSWSAFFLGGFYSVLGITIARFLFAADPALPAVAFTSLFILPELYTLFQIEEKEQVRDKKSDIRAFWRDNGDFFRVLLLLFLGILLVYSLAAMVLPGLAVNDLFREQLAMRAMPGFGAAGLATSGPSSGAFALFERLLANNALVLTAVFVVALLAGDGAIFLLTWNASVWGTIFGVTARNAAFATQGDPFTYFMQILFTVTPHVLLEASAYILAAMAGGLISRAIIRDGLGSKRFVEAFKDNLTIIGLAVACLVVGVAVETFVLMNSDGYARIIQLSLGLR
jgi:uncharacterized membrane protein SpoIIM required for sporulation